VLWLKRHNSQRNRGFETQITIEMEWNKLFENFEGTSCIVSFYPKQIKFLLNFTKLHLVTCHLVCVWIFDWFRRPTFGQHFDLYGNRKSVHDWSGSHFQLRIKTASSWNCRFQIYQKHQRPSRSFRLKVAAFSYGSNFITFQNQ
jgi:hypothetical protein